METCGTDDGTTDTYPQPAFELETDSVDHCTSYSRCLEPLDLDGALYGAVLTTYLTAEGVRDVRERHAERPSRLTRYWMDYFNIASETR
jgi:hypothetical protein